LPLGFLISVTDAELKSLSSHSSDDEFDDALSKLFEAKQNENLAVDTGRGHMSLEGYLLQSEVVDEVPDLSGVLLGRETVRIVDGGELVVMFNSASGVKKITASLEATTHDDLNTLYVSTELEMANRRFAPSIKKPGFFGKLFGQKEEVAAPVEPEIGTINSSLVELFDEVCKLYKTATIRQDNIITMVRV